MLVYFYQWGPLCRFTESELLIFLRVCWNGWMAPQLLMSVKRHIGPLPNCFVLAPIIYLYFLIRNTKTDYFPGTIIFFSDPLNYIRNTVIFSFGRRRWYIFVFIYISPVTRVRFPPGLMPFCKLSSSWDINATWDTHRNSKNSYQKMRLLTFPKIIFFS